MKGRLLLFFVILMVFSSLSNLSETINTPTWWDTSWHYRVGVQVNTTNYNRTDWPVEVSLNFTSLLQSMGETGTFSINSTRVVEHNSTGGVMYEIPSQFDPAENGSYDNVSNAVGTVVFLLNGTSIQGTKRYFYVYFDKAENGPKVKPSYASSLAYSWSGEEFYVNNSYFRWRADTVRGQNTSGLYEAYGIASAANIFWTASNASKTKEYTQVTNGTTSMMFDFRNNASFTAGPIRMTVVQAGDEAYWNDPGNKTGEGFMIKKYYFYANTSWIRIEHNFTNKGAGSINRSSIYGGIVSFEMNSTESVPPNPDNQLWGNSTNPASWYGAADVGSTGIGIVNENQTGTSNSYATYDYPVERMGIRLNMTEIPGGQSLLQKAAVVFNDTTFNELTIRSLRDNLADPPKLTILAPDNLAFEVQASVNYSIYNRGEAALVFGTVTSDPYGQSQYINATFDMATPGTGDDQTIALYDDGSSSHGDAIAGDKVFSNYFNLTASNMTGTWNVSMRAYDSAGVFLNSSSLLFNLTDQYSVTTVVDNPLGLAGRIVNATINVTNIRNDTYIPGAQLNCTYGTGPLTNITDYGNGTYALNFTATMITGAYLLNCSASKINNSGWDTDYFYTEAATTGVNITSSPIAYNASNITWYAPENFTLTLNVSNTGNATARSLNITLYLPSSASADTNFSQCSDVNIGSYCLRSFNITVLNQTSPGGYVINVTTFWRNPDASAGGANSTFNITVLSNPKIEVPQAVVSGTVGDGENREVGSFNVTSFGNYNATNITFSVTGFPFAVSFTPVNLSAVEPNKTSMVRVNVSVPPEYSPGTYNGSINVSSADGGWDNLTIQAWIPSNTTLATAPVLQSYNASNITWYAPENFTLTINSTNTGNATARYANVTLYLPPVASGPAFYSCGNVSVLSSCIAPFNITIASQTSPGTYTLNVTANWRNADSTIGESNSTFNITVLSNPKIEVPQAVVSGTVGDGENREVGSFNVTSFGNYNATNITFSVTGFPFAVSFTPVNLSAVEPNKTSMVRVNVSVPLTYAAGNYSGTVNASAKNDGWDTLTMNVSVPENRSWSRSPASCIVVEVADVGPACVITINNTGNSPINMSLFPSEVNHTSINETNFTLAYASKREILVSYNVSGNQKGYYNATYAIYANTTNTTPENMTFDIYLFPYLEPVILPASSATSIGQNNSVEITANVTDLSGAGINWTYANVTVPSGRIFTSNMSITGTSGNMTFWKAAFPANFSDVNLTANDTPSTSERGIYNISISSADLTGAIGHSYSYFKVHRNISVLLNSPYARYPEGDSSCTEGGINYTAIELGSTAASGLNVSLGIRSSDNFTWLMIPRQYITYDDGRIYDDSGQSPVFKVCTSALAGNYTVISTTSFYDALSNETVQLQKNASFEVYPRQLTLELVNPTFESSNLAFRIWVRDIFGAYIAPDSMNISLYRDVFLSNNTVMSILDNSFNMSDSRVVRENTSVGPKYIVSLSGLSTSAAYWVQVSASYGKRVGLGEKTFNPGVRTWYDVALVMQDYEVNQGDYLDAELTVVNRIGPGQDVFVEYWISNAGLEAKSWYSASMHWFVGQETTVFIPLRAYIFPAQPYGNYWFYARVTPSNDTSGFSWQAHDAFQVVQKEVKKPSYPAPPPTTGAAVTPSTEKEDRLSVSISRYPKNISTVRGWTDVSSIEVKNTGTLPLSNLTLAISGVPANWYSLRPNGSTTISEGNSTVYLLEFRIPLDATLGTYDLIFKATANGGARDEKFAALTIFSSVSEMLLAEILELKLRLQNLEIEARQADAAGKNVTLVWPPLEKARAEIGIAEKSLANASYVDAQNHVLIAKDLLDRAEFLLASAQYIKISPEKIVPFWLLALVILLALLASFAMLWSFRLKRRMNVFFRSPALMEKIVQRFRKENDEHVALRTEREKLLRMQNLLEKEVQDGTITHEAYDELKKRTLEKISELDKKLRG